MTNNQKRDAVEARNKTWNDLSQARASVEPAPASRYTNHASASPDHWSVPADLSDVKREIERLSNVVADIAESRARQAVTAVDDGMNGVRSAIRQNPWTSIGIAGVVGIVIALATTSRSVDARHLGRLHRSARRSFNRFDARSLIPDMQDLRGYLPDIPISKSSLADRAEKLGNAIADIDPKAAAGPLLEAARGISQAISRMRT